MKTFYIVVTIALSALLGVAIGLNLHQQPVPLGSVQTGSEYHATTTYPAMPAFNYLKTEGGTLGSLVVTKASTATSMNYLYDATTTNANLRAVSMATTSITLLAWPNNLAAGTYTLDEVFFNGLILENSAGAIIASSTITYR